MEPIFTRIKPGESGGLISFLNEVFSGSRDSGHFEENLPRMFLNYSYLFCIF